MSAKGGISMSVLTNIRIDEELKRESDELFKSLGLTFSSAVNLFLKTAVREQCLPLSLSLKVPSSETIQAIEEGRRIARDPHVPGYESLEELFAALDEE